MANGVNARDAWATVAVFMSVLAALGLAGSAAPDAKAGDQGALSVPPRIAGSFSGSLSQSVPSGATINAKWSGTITFVRKRRDPQNAYYAAERIAWTESTSMNDSLTGCKADSTSTESVGPQDESYAALVLALKPTSGKGQKYEIHVLVGPPVVGKITLICPSLPPEQLTNGWMSGAVVTTAPGHYYTDGRTFRGSNDGQPPYSFAWSLRGSPGKVKAVATTTGAVRGATVKLDGSRSRKNITSYVWTFVPGPDCPSNVQLKNARLSGKRVQFRLLCSLKATLTVSNGADDDSTTITVPVRQRKWKTPFSHRTVDGGPGAPTARPEIVSCGTEGCKVAIDGGVNLPDCPGTPRPGSNILCPLLDSGTSWLGHGYTLATIHDRGPFDGFSYVASSTLAVKRKGLINPNLLAGGAAERDGNNFYNFNKRKGAPVDAFLTAVRQHEGLGAPGKPRTGHSGAMKADLGTPGGDPRREIEKLFDPSPTELQQQVDKTLKAVDGKLDADSADPLPVIWTGPLWFWYEYGGDWRSGTIHVP